MKKKAPPTCPACGTKLLASGRCIKWRRCEPFLRNEEELKQAVALAFPDWRRKPDPKVQHGAALSLEGV